MRRRSMLFAAGAAALSTPLGGRAFAAASGSGPILDHTTPVDLDGSEYVDLSNRAAYSPRSPREPSSSPSAPRATTRR